MSVIVWSVSQSSAYQCPRQWWLNSVASTKPAQPEAPNRARGRAIHAAIEHAYQLATRQNFTPGFMIKFIEPALTVLWDLWGRHRRQDDYNNTASQITTLFLTLPIPAPHAVLGIEEKATLEVSDEFGSYRVNCVLDLVLQTGPTSAHIRDWKSGRIDDDVSRNVQLAVYDLAARTLWPWLTKVTVGLYSVAQNRETEPVELEIEDRHASVEDLLYDASDAHAALSEVRQGILTVMDAFPTRPGERCSSCVFRSYCPEWSGALLPLRPGFTTQDVARERARLAHRFDLVNP